MSFQQINPKEKIQILKKEELKDHIAIIGDIHGCFKELDELITKLPSSCSIISVGDIVNKGPNSVECLKLLEKHYAVRGNHESNILLEHLNIKKSKDNDKKLLNLLKEDNQLLQYLKELPYVIHIPHLALSIIHGGLMPNHSELSNINTNEELNNILRLRHVHKEADQWIGSSKIAKTTSKATQWWNTYKGPNTLITGHFASSKIIELPFIKMIDSGCVYGYKLTAILFSKNNLNNYKIIEVPCQTSHSLYYENNLPDLNLNH